MTTFKEAASVFGKIGGHATSKKYGPEHYKKMQAKSVLSRRRNKKKKSKKTAS